MSGVVVKPAAVGVCLLLLLVPLSCASTGDLSARPDQYGSPTAEQAVRSFLDAARQRDYQTMGRQFGTREGPAEQELGVAEVEQRMVVLAGLLRHDGYELQRRNLSRFGQHRTGFVAEMTGTRRARRGNGDFVARLPIVAVSTDEGRWFVEQLEMDSFTGGTGP